MVVVNEGRMFIVCYGLVDKGGFNSITGFAGLNVSLMMELTLFCMLSYCY
jgi:hypothetical protein